MTPDEVVNSLGNLSMALGVLDKLPQHLIKDALNNVIPSAISLIQDYQKLRESKEVTPLDFNFQCGCFLRVYLDMNYKLNAGLACCQEHEFKEAKAAFFRLQLDLCECPLNDYQLKNFGEGYHGTCRTCEKPVIITHAIDTKMKEGRQ